MNRLPARVTGVQNVDTLYIVTFEWCGGTLKMVSLDLDHQLQDGDHVVLGVNFTSVAIAKSLSGEVSYVNQISAWVNEIEKGELLSIVKLVCGESVVESLLVSESLDRLQLDPGDEVTMIIKANDIFLLEVLS